MAIPGTPYKRVLIGVADGRSSSMPASSAWAAKVRGPRTATTPRSSECQLRQFHCPKLPVRHRPTPVVWAKLAEGPTWVGGSRSHLKQARPMRAPKSSLANRASESRSGFLNPRAPRYEPEPTTTDPLAGPRAFERSQQGIFTAPVAKPTSQRRRVRLARYRIGAHSVVTMWSPHP